MVTGFPRNARALHNGRLGWEKGREHFLSTGGVPVKHRTLWASCDKHLARLEPVIPGGAERERMEERPRRSMRPWREARTHATGRENMTPDQI